MELEIFVKQSSIQKGVGRCLMDKLMLVLDQHYVDRGGYEFVGNDVEYGSGGKRVIGSVVVNITYDASDNKRLVWLQNWLTQWNFEQAGELSQIGHKLNTVYV